MAYRGARRAGEIRVTDISESNHLVLELAERA